MIQNQIVYYSQVSTLICHNVFFSIRDIIEELQPLIKEAIDRRQENLRRRRKRDVCRLAIVKIFETMAQNGIFAQR